MPRPAVHELMLEDPLERINLGFMGACVVAGSATAVVVETGMRTCLGALAHSLEEPEARTSFGSWTHRIGRAFIDVPFRKKAAESCHHRIDGL